MAFNVDQFRRELVFDGARPNLFRVRIPDFFGSSAGQTRNFEFMCKTTSMPGSTMGVIEVPYFGRAAKIAGNRVFPEWTVSVINDESFNLRDAFMEWHRLLNDNRANMRSNAALNSIDYTRNAYVDQFAKSGVGSSLGGVLQRLVEEQPIKTYKCVGIFPSDISAIDLDWGSNDQLEEFTVTFAIQHWEDVTGSQVSIPDLGGGNLGLDG